MKVKLVDVVVVVKTPGILAWDMNALTSTTANFAFPRSERRKIGRIGPGRSVAPSKHAISQISARSLTAVGCDF